MIFENFIHERIQYLYYFSFSPSNILSHYLKFKTSYLIILRMHIHDWLSLFSVFCISMYLGLTTWCWITCRGRSFLEKADFGLPWRPLVAYSTSFKGAALWQFPIHSGVLTSIVIMYSLFGQKCYWNLMSTASLSWHFLTAGLVVV